MKRRHKLNLLLLIAPTALGIAPVTFSSCSQKHTIGGIDGSNWKGLRAGSFIEHDYIIDEEERTVTYISGLSIHSYDLIIPDYVNHDGTVYKVLLGPKCFADNYGIAGTVELNDFIVDIPDECFMNCTSLTGIIFHQPPNSIGNLAFNQCLLLTKIYLLQGGQLDEDWTTDLKEIGVFAFSRCSSLSGELVFGSQLSSIGEYAFNSCTALETVNLKFCSRITNISKGAFGGCTFIKKLYLPSTLISIGDEAFKGCTHLYVIDVPIRGMSISLGDNTFYGCENLATTTKVCRVNHIGKGCFSFNKQLEWPIWRPEYGLDVIPPYAFSSCSFSSLAFSPNGTSEIMDYAFSNNSMLTVLDFSEYKPFIDDEGRLDPNVPKWTGKHIFHKANENGGTIIVSEGNLYNTEWRDFFEKNDLVIDRNHWSVITPKQLIQISEPEQKSYEATSETEYKIEMSNFQISLSQAEKINPEHFAVSFRPFFINEDKQKVYLDYEVEPVFDWTNKTFTLQITIFDPVPGTYSGQMFFYYKNIRVYSPESTFEIKVI